MLILQHAYDTKYDYVLDYYNSYDKNTRYKDITSFSVLNAKDYKDYMECITYYEKELYYLIDTTNPSYILGHGLLNIRSSKKNLKDYATVAYGVRESERLKGYGTLILTELLPIAEEKGLRRLIITCLSTNEGSRSIIETNEGIFNRTYLDDHNKEMLEYEINLKEQIKTRR